MHCRALTDLELSERLEKMGTRAFWGFEGLQRIAICFHSMFYVRNTTSLIDASN